MTEPRLALWEFEVRVVTPDGQILTGRYASSPATLPAPLDEDHFDWFMERLTADVKRELKPKGYMK